MDIEEMKAVDIRTVDPERLVDVTGMPRYYSDGGYSSYSRGKGSGASSGKW